MEHWIWLGLDRRIGQYVVFDKQLGGVRHARTMMPMPQSQQWSLARLQEVDTAPWTKFEGPAPVMIPKEHAPDEAAPAREPATRRLYIRQRDLEEHGHTPDCPRCDHILAHGPKDATVPHSEICRTRLVEAVSKT